MLYHALQGPDLENKVSCILYTHIGDYLYSELIPIDVFIKFCYLKINYFITYNCFC